MRGTCQVAKVYNESDKYSEKIGLWKGEYKEKMETENKDITTKIKYLKH